MSSSNRVSTVVIGAGHAGLCMSRKLQKAAISHVVLEQGEIANAWKTQRWDSLKLLTPNSQFRMPDYCYTGRDPQGFMEKKQVEAILERYAQYWDCPVQEHTRVSRVSRRGEEYLVDTNKGRWQCRSVVLASGAFNSAVYPSVAGHIPSTLNTIHSRDYKNPAQLVPGKVLVVGASASGLQIAEELRSAGFSVTLSVGEHVRVPRTYRGKDIFWWFEKSGIARESVAMSEDIKRLHRLPSPQLVGSDHTQMLDLNYLQKNGVEIVGKLNGVNSNRLQFSGSLLNVCKLADLKLERLLERFDNLKLENEFKLKPRERFEETRINSSQLMITTNEFTNIVWATGLKADYSWLDVPVLDNKGQLIHKEGVLPFPGLYVLGLPAMRQRHSSFLHGIKEDVDHITEVLLEFLSPAEPAGSNVVMFLR